MILKKGVKLQGARVELVIALQVASAVYVHFNETCVITSLLDGKHSRNSLHYCGQAADLRIKDINMAKVRLIHEELRQRLTDDFDVILESTHIHIEYQPRNNS